MSFCSDHSTNDKCIVAQDYKKPTFIINNDSQSVAIPVYAKTAFNFFFQWVGNPLANHTYNPL